MHVVCTLWFRELEIDSMSTFANLSLAQLEERRWHGTCGMCRDRGDAGDGGMAEIGVKVGCDAGGCREVFHATCGHRFDLLEVDADPGRLEW